jgi:hypothetical protein
MKLFKYEGYEVRVAPEALTLKPFKKLWDRDKSKTKEKATMELSFLYFYCDPRSDYQYIVDDSDRMDAVKEGIGFDSNWKPDATLQKAIDFYGTFDTPAAELLRTSRTGVEKVRKLVETLEPDDTKSLKDYLTVMKLIPEVASMISEAEKTLNAEEEYGEARGQIEKAMFDDGLDDVADWVSQQK